MANYLAVTGIILNFARVFESRDGGMVDTRDLKSLDQEWLCGVESRSRHQRESRSFSSKKPFFQNEKAVLSHRKSRSFKMKKPFFP